MRKRASLDYLDRVWELEFCGLGVGGAEAAATAAAVEGAVATDGAGTFAVTGWIGFSATATGGVEAEGCFFWAASMACFILAKSI